MDSKTATAVHSAKTNAIVIFSDAAYFPLAYTLAIDAYAGAGHVADVIIFTDAAELVERYAGGSQPLVRIIDSRRCTPINAASRGRLSAAAYYRLFIGELLPDSYKRALYLDCDIAVDPGFAGIFSIDMQGAAIAAAVDGGDILRRDGKHAIAWQKHLRDIGLASDAPYFNSGVLLIDLDAWRSVGVVDEACAFLADLGDRATCMDQDTLNYVFRGRWFPLPQRYNFQTPFMALCLEEVAKPLIWHYSGDLKPWTSLTWQLSQSHVERFRSRLDAAGWPDFIARHQTPDRLLAARRARLERFMARFRPGSKQRHLAKLAKQREFALELLHADAHNEQAVAGAGRPRVNAVTFFADEAYFPLAFVAGLAAHAAVKHTADVYIFTNSKVLAERYASHDKLKILFLDIQSKIPDSVPVRPGASRMAFGRFFLGELLAREYKRVLYLDCDVAVEPNLSDAFDLDLGGHPIGAVMDCNFIANQSGKARRNWHAHMETIGLPPDAPYFNSGVLLIDLDDWRRAEIPAKAVWFFANQAAPRSMDQDALNYIFFEKWAELPARWNFQTLYLPYHLEDRIDPVVWHYVDTVKPWHDLLWQHDRSHVRRYREAFAGTDWPDFVKDQRRFKQIKTRLNRKLKRLILSLRRSKLRREREKQAEWSRNATALLLRDVG